MATSSLSVKSTTTAGKSVQKAVTNINPQASAENLSTFAQMINSLTNHTYVGADLIDKTNVDTETRPGGGSGKIEGVITLTQTAALGEYDISYNGDGTVQCLRGSILGNKYNATDEYDVVYALATDNYTAAVCFFESENVSPAPAG